MDYLIYYAVATPLALAGFVALERWRSGYVTEDESLMYVGLALIWPVALFVFALVGLAKVVHKLANA